MSEAAGRDRVIANRIFRLPGALKSNPATDAWFSEQVPELGNIAHQWFLRMKQCGDDVTELLHDGCPVACVADAAFAYVNAFKSHVNVGFFHGAELADPGGLLEGTGKYMRHVKLRPAAGLNNEALDALIDAAHADIKRRLAAD